MVMCPVPIFAPGAEGPVVDVGSWSVLVDCNLTGVSRGRASLRKSQAITSGTPCFRLKENRPIDFRDRKTPNRGLQAPSDTGVRQYCRVRFRIAQPDAGRPLTMRTTGPISGLP